MKPEDSPAYQCASYTAQMLDWQIVNDCYRGTRAIRARGVEYLPKEPAEKPQAYRIRLSRANFWNAFRRTVMGLVGMTFRKDPEWSNDIPKEIQQHLENIDLQGTHAEVFLKQVDTAAKIDGHTFIYVDMPPKLKAGSTLADERAAGRRPYWIHYLKSQVINWQTETVNGRVRLTLAVIKECIKEPRGVFGEATIEQYRILRAGLWNVEKQMFDEGLWEIWREIKRDGWATGEYEAVESGSSSLSEIPLVAIYSNRTGFFESDPPLLPLALENLRHYRLQSDLDHIMHVANVPLLVAIGRSNTKEPLVVGVNNTIDVPLNGDLKYVEHHGYAIGEATKELDRSKANMAALGLAILSGKPQVQATATESVLNNEAESSELASMVRALQDGTENALGFHAQYLGLPDGGSIQFNDDFAAQSLTWQDIQVLSVMVEKRQLSVESMWAVMERAEWVIDDFNAIVEKQRLDAMPPPTLPPAGNQTASSDVEMLN
jgi:hypothetical protein